MLIPIAIAMSVSICVARVGAVTRGGASIGPESANVSHSIFVRDKVYSSVDEQPELRCDTLFP